MRTLIAAALAAGLAFSLPVASLAADEPAEAQPGLEAIRGVLKAPKTVKLRKVKVNAGGDVCAMVSSGGNDTEVMWTKANGAIWIHEAETAQDTILAMGGPNIIRSDARANFLAWRTCQKG